MKIDTLNGRGEVGSVLGILIIIEFKWNNSKRIKKEYWPGIYSNRHLLGDSVIKIILNLC